MKHFKNIFIFLTFLSIIPFVFGSGNVIFNSSFELGENGWSVFRETFPKKNQAADLKPSWSIDDKTAYIGKKSFRMWNPVQEARRVVCDSHNILVKLGQSYTVSYWAKSSINGVKLGCYLFSNQRMLRRTAKGQLLPDRNFGDCSKDKESVVRGPTVTLTSNWKRYSYQFTPEKGFTAYTLRFSLNNFSRKDSKQINNNIYLDGVQLAKGSLTTYAPKSEIEAAVSTNDYLYEDTDTIKGVVKIVSYNKDRNIKLPLLLFDTYFEKKLQEKNLDFSLKKGVVSEKNFSFNSVPYGMFCIYTGLQPRTTPKGFHAEWDKQPECLSYERLRYGDESYQSAAYFTSVAKNLPVTTYGFRMGTTGPLDNYLIWCCGSINGSTEEILRILRLSGGNVLRCWDPGLCVWSRISHAKGKYSWEASDERIAAAEKTGIPLMCVLGGSFAKKRKQVPKWAQKRDRSGNPDGTLCDPKTWFGKSGQRYFRPKLEDWREYVSAVVNRYKGRIKYYELLNESDLYMPVTIYMEYMKIAADEIRRADPKAVILGICSTADKTVDPNANTKTALGKCLDLGASKYMDHITIHPYAMLDNSSKHNQVDERRNHMAFLKTKGIKAGLWNGENYFIIPNWMPHTNYAGRWEPENLARHLIVDMGEGLIGSTPTHYLQSLLSSQLHPFVNATSKFGCPRRYPNARFAVHSACGQFLAGATPLYSLKLKAGAIGYVFKNGKRTLSAVWNSRAKQQTELILNPPKGSEVIIYDVMGNKIKQSSGQVKLPLSVRPYYLEFTGCSAKAASDALNNSPITCELPLKIERALIIRNGQEAELLVNIQNMSGTAKDNYISIKSDAFLAPVKLRFSDFQDFQTKTFKVPVKLKNPDMKIVKFQAQTDFGRKTMVSGNALVKSAVNINGVPQWFEINKCVSGKVNGPKDLSAKFSIKHQSGRKLILNVKIKDDKYGTPSRSAWNQDCIELFVDRTPVAGSGKITQYMIPLKAGVNRQYNMVAKVKKVADGYEAQVKIGIGNSKLVGFGIAIDDSDSNKREAQVVWRGTDENYKDRNALTMIKIIEGMAARIDIKYKKNNGKWDKYRYGKNDAAGKEWIKHSFSFTPEENRTADFLLRSAWTRNKKGRYWIDYRNIKVSGAKLKNSDFSQVNTKAYPLAWHLKKRAKLIKDGDINYIKVTHDEFCLGKLQVEAGKPVTVSYEVRAGRAVD